MFEAAYYYAPWDWNPPDFPGQNATDEDWEAILDSVVGTPEEERMRAIVGRLRAGLPPETIDDLLFFNDDAGTHSVIDIVNGTSDAPGPQVAAPFTTDELERMLGTASPSEERLGEHKEDVFDRIRLWESRYVVVYTDGQPSHIYFFGVSGD